MTNLKEAQKLKKLYTFILNNLQRKAARGDKDAAHAIVPTMTAYLASLKRVGYTYEDNSSRLITLERYNRLKTRQ
mgnify:CR=1 FL=1